ncbi:MAG TPA: YfiR family protein [Nitrospiria bacterium]|nr:YfiR family protein [Nitrospiria bacterium]
MSSIVLGIGMVSVQAETLTSTEYQVKAAFIYNFSKFVEWPTETLSGDKPFVIGVLGRDPFDNALDETVSGKTVQEKKIAVKRFSKVEDALTCNVLFISNSEKDNMAKIIERLDHLPVLTVSDIGRFAEQGGMIQLIVDQNRVRFAVNRAATDKAGLKPSSQLLKLAQIVTSR